MLIPKATEYLDEVYSNTSDVTNDSISEAIILGDIFQAVSFIIIFVPGMILNIMIITLIVKYNSLHQCGFLVAFQIFVCNIFYLLFLMPVSTVSSIAHGWVFGDIGCNAVGFLVEWMRVLRFFLTLVLALDRSFLVYFPFGFVKYEKKFVKIASVVAWFGSLVFALVPLPWFLDCYNYSPFIKYCFIGPLEVMSCDVHVRVSIYSQYTAGAVIPFFLYIALYYKARKISRKIKLEVGQGGNEASNRSSTSRRRQNATFMLLVFNVFGLSFPHFIFFNVINLLASRISIPIELIVFTNVFVRFFFLLSSVLDPIVVMRNSDMRGVLVKVKQSFKRKLGTSLNLVSTGFESTS